MQAKTTSPQAGSLATWLVAILGVGLLVILLLSFVLERQTGAGSQVAGLSSSSRIAYFEFGRDADTLWLANPADLSDRTRLFAGRPFELTSAKLVAKAGGFLLARECRRYGVETS